jgi:hypothetical protein
MREDWTLQRYVTELQNLADLEFDDVVHPDLIQQKYKFLKREMVERFSPEELFLYGIIF